MVSTSIDYIVQNGNTPVFKQKGNILTPKEVFDKLYSGLDPLISFNLQKLELSKKGIDITTQAYIEGEQERFLDWANNAPDNIQAEINLDDKIYTFNVNARTDLEYSNHNDPTKRSLRTRLPNIVYLEETKTGKSSILRRATFWPKKILKGRIASFKKPNRVNHEWLKAVETKDSWGEYLNPNKIHLIPEPILRVGLKNLESNYGTIIAKGKEIEFDQENKDLYIVRPFFDSISEKTVNLERLTDYIASIHSLGLTDKEDRQFKHYCSLRNGKSIVNIDPDFYVFTGKFDGILQEDRRNFFQDMSVLSPVINSKAKELYKIATEKINKKGKKEFLDALPRNMREIKEALNYNITQ
ncbi:MAG: hypothetical protein ACMXX7_01940 [Candidatus Woesearchaeota archaeon]